MRRRGFLQLAGAAVLGVLTAKVPVFAEELPLPGYIPAATATGMAIDSMWVYPAHYAIPITFDMAAPTDSLEGKTYLYAAYKANYEQERRWNHNGYNRGYISRRPV